MGLLHTRRGFVWLALVAGLAAGCGHTVSRTVTRRAFDGLPPEAGLRAYVYRDHLILRFTEGSRETIFKADWKERGLESVGEHRFRTTQLSLVEKLPKGIEEVRASVREATIAPAERLQALRPELADRLVPRGAGEGAFLALGAPSSWRTVTPRTNRGSCRQPPPPATCASGAGST